MPKLADPTDALGRSSDEDAEEDAVPQDSIDFALGFTSTAANLYTSHPPASQILELWNIYLENFDPLTKIVHPTLQSAIEKAIVDLSSLPKSLEALLFAVYGAAVLSLNDDDCHQRFGESRKALLSRYRLATKTALSRAKLMASVDLMVLQALLIHLLSTREVYGSRTLWTLTGVALRIAEGMGVHRDGSIVKLSPFETEMRRRIWWQLKLLDGDSAEASGSDKFGAFETDPRSTRLPASIDDDELHPDMPLGPVSTNRATDMIFCSLRFDLRTYWTRIAATQPQQSNGWPWTTDLAMNERDKAVDDFENFLETKYIRYCDPSQPIQLLATLLARTAVSTTRLIAHHPRTWLSDNQIPDSERRFVWDLSIKSIRQYNSVHLSRELQHFSWHAAFYFRWPAFIHVLDTLRASPLLEKATDAWHLIGEVFATHPDFVTNTKKALYVAVNNLCLKAYAAREGALAREGLPIPPAPSYISMFRKQREAANARRKIRESAPENKHATINSLPLDPQSVLKEPNTTFPTMRIPEQSTGLGTTALPELWPSDGNTRFPDSLPMFTNDTTNMEIDMLLAQNSSMEDPLDQTIDWAQWDALLGDFT